MILNHEMNHAGRHRFQTYVVIRITWQIPHLEDIQDVAKSFSQNDKKEVTISYN